MGTSFCGVDSDCATVGVAGAVCFRAESTFLLEMGVSSLLRILLPLETLAGVLLLLVDTADLVGVSFRLIFGTALGVAGVPAAVRSAVLGVLLAFFKADFNNVFCWVDFSTEAGVLTFFGLGVVRSINPNFGEPTEDAVVSSMGLHTKLLWPELGEVRSIRYMELPAFDLRGVALAETFSFLGVK